MIAVIKKDALYEELLQSIRNGKYPPEHRFPTETDFALELGVSRNTVRAALKRLEEERHIIRLKGKGTFVAPAAPPPKHGNILILTNFTSDERYPYHYILPAIKEEAARRGRGIETCEFSQFSIFTPERAREVIEQNHIDAMIIITSNFIGNEPIIPLTRQLRIPVVLAHGYREDYAATGWAVVSCDFHAAWKTGLEHLAEQGHRKIITVTCAAENHSVRQYSRKEYHKLLRRLHLDDSDELILEFPLESPEEIDGKLQQLLSRPGAPPTAVMAYSDFMVPQIYRTLERMNLRIPNDIAVMGFCGGMNVKFFEPPLSTVDLEYAECGRIAVEIAATASEWFEPSGEGTRAPPLIYCPFHLIRNASTAIRRFENRYKTIES